MLEVKVENAIPVNAPHPLTLPSFCGIRMETAFSNVDCKASSVALKERLFTTSVLLAAAGAPAKGSKIKKTGETKEMKEHFL